MLCSAGSRELPSPTRRTGTFLWFHHCHRTHEACKSQTISVFLSTLRELWVMMEDKSQNCPKQRNFSHWTLKVKQNLQVFSLFGQIQVWRKGFVYAFTHLLNRLTQCLCYCSFIHIFYHKVNTELVSQQSRAQLLFSSFQNLIKHEKESWPVYLYFWDQEQFLCVMREELSWFDGVLSVYFKGSELSLVCFTLTLYKLNSLSLSWFYERRCLFLEGQILGEDHLIFWCDKNEDIFSQSVCSDFEGCWRGMGLRDMKWNVAAHSETTQLVVFNSSCKGQECQW